MKRAPFAFLLASALFFVQGDDVQENPLPKLSEAAPVFRLNDHTGQAHTVGGEAEQWTALAFYPKALTPG